MLKFFQRNNKEQKEPEMADAPKDNSTVVLETVGVTEFAELKKQYEQVLVVLADKEAALEAFTQERAKAIEDAHKAKMDSRLSVLKANIGDAQAPAVLSATEGLDDAAFAVMCNAMATSQVKESASEMFKEVGVEAPQGALKPVTDGGENLKKILAAKFGAPKK